MIEVVGGIAFIRDIEKKSLECREGNEIVVLKLCDLCNTIYPIYKKIFGDGFIADMLIKDLKNSSLKVQKAIENFPNETKYVSMMYSYNLKKYQSIHKLKRDLNNGIINFLWMKRTIEFIVIFLEKCYITNYSSKLSACAMDAYDEVLKSYHGYMTRNIVKLALKLSPSREVLTERLQLGSNEQTKLVLQKCLSIAKPLIDDISKIIERNNCNFAEKI
ncbi:glycolipid transfer protein [Plasmodium brasilianum]|uniref:Glycolipid transfer protein, putative n=2 Tax=Plasmodium (Plasmodium) TaxID=418103 RepID=A0A1A8VTB8_PLAMA|nr:glycolipid transfer protein, putative [Plasmodium malariae]KAI4839394.1 glycolipid transfer protein [Plasmodium brasilianum]SBS83775.1 glycolipid transfer protein, putative (GLTP) [Plasmodium malariae]SBT87812.1 glycolipid transfer protein, putative [Plasmodium malariae]